MWSRKLDRNVVVIAEDPSIRRFLCSVLRRAGVRTVELSSSADLDQVRSGEVHIRALITNTPQAFRAFAGDPPLVYTSSCPDAAATEGFSHCRVLQKPFDGTQLLQALQDVTQSVIT